MNIGKNEIVWAKVREDAIIPTKTLENAGYDIYANFEEDFLILPKGQTTIIPTGIASAMDASKYAQIQERGSTGVCGMKYSAGVIDSNFRGEWKILIYNANQKDIVISKLTRGQLMDKYGTCLYVERDGYTIGVKLVNADNPNASAYIYPYEKAIAQAVIHKVPVMTSREVSYEELMQIESDRGTGMFGSSGK